MYVYRIRSALRRGCVGGGEGTLMVTCMVTPNWSQGKVRLW